MKQQKLIFRRQTVADVLDCSQAQVIKFERAGLLHPRKLADGPLKLRMVTYDPAEVAALAKRLLSSGNGEEGAPGRREPAR